MIRRLDLLSSGGGASCWGVGFVAMDVVDVEDDRFAAVGGSCGNVMVILAWFGVDGEACRPARQRRYGRFHPRGASWIGRGCGLPDRREVSAVADCSATIRHGTRRHAYTSVLADLSGMRAMAAATPVCHARTNDVAGVRRRGPKRVLF